MDREELRANCCRAPCRALHCVGDVVELEVEKDIFAECAQSLHDLRADRCKKLPADLVKLARVAQSIDHRQREVGARKIECNDWNWFARRSGCGVAGGDFRSGSGGPMRRTHVTIPTAPRPSDPSAISRRGGDTISPDRGLLCEADGAPASRRFPLPPKMRRSGR